MDKNKEYLILPELSHYQEIFDGGLNHEQISKTAGIEMILSNKEGWRQLDTRLKRVKHVATLAAPAKYIDTYGMFTNPARSHLNAKLKSAHKSIELLDLTKHLQRMRMVKQPVELLAINQAIENTIAGMEYVRQRYLQEKYTHEFDIQLDLDRLYWQGGSDKHSFDPIIATGASGLTLHESVKGAIKPGDQLLLDVGADYKHYAADITRTWQVAKSKRFENVKSAVGEVCDYALSMLKPGVMLSDYEKKVEYFMGEKLRELGLIKSISHENVRQFFTHATSHFLGLDVHDDGDYSRPMEAGVVLTVEPGIYIPAEGIGVRVEDDVLITATGAKNLSLKLKR